MNIFKIGKLGIMAGAAAIALGANAIIEKVKSKKTTDDIDFDDNATFTADDVSVEMTEVKDEDDIDDEKEDIEE